MNLDFDRFEDGLSDWTLTQLGSNITDPTGGAPIIFSSDFSSSAGWTDASTGGASTVFSGGVATCTEDSSSFHGTFHSTSPYTLQVGAVITWDMRYTSGNTQIAWLSTDFTASSATGIGFYNNSGTLQIILATLGSNDTPISWAASTDTINCKIVVNNDSTISAYAKQSTSGSYTLIGHYSAGGPDGVGGSLYPTFFAGSSAGSNIIIDNFLWVGPSPAILLDSSDFSSSTGWTSVTSNGTVVFSSGIGTITRDGSSSFDGCGIYRTAGTFLGLGDEIKFDFKTNNVSSGALYIGYLSYHAALELSLASTAALICMTVISVGAIYFQYGVVGSGVFTVSDNVPYSVSNSTWYTVKYVVNNDGKISCYVKLQGASDSTYTYVGTSDISLAGVTGFFASQTRFASNDIELDNFSWAGFAKAMLLHQTDSDSNTWDRIKATRTTGIASSISQVIYCQWMAPNISTVTEDLGILVLAPSLGGDFIGTVMGRCLGGQFYLYDDFSNTNIADNTFLPLDNTWYDIKFEINGSSKPVLSIRLSTSPGDIKSGSGSWTTIGTGTQVVPATIYPQFQLRTRSPNTDLYVDEYVYTDDGTIGTYSYLRSNSESLSTSDSLARSVSNLRSITDALSVTDAVDLNRGFLRSLSESLSVFDRSGPSTGLFFRQDLSDIVTSNSQVRQLLPSPDSGEISASERPISGSLRVMRYVPGTTPGSANTADLGSLPTDVGSQGWIFDQAATVTFSDVFNDFSKETVITNVGSATIDTGRAKFIRSSGFTNNDLGIYTSEAFTLNVGSEITWDWMATQSGDSGYQPESTTQLRDSTGIEPFNVSPGLFISTVYYHTRPGSPAVTDNTKPTDAYFYQVQNGSDPSAYALDYFFPGLVYRFKWVVNSDGTLSLYYKLATAPTYILMGTSSLSDIPNAIGRSVRLSHNFTNGSTGTYTWFIDNVNLTNVDNPNRLQGIFLRGAWEVQLIVADTSATGTYEVSTNLFVVTANTTGVTKVAQIGTTKTSSPLTPSTTPAQVTFSWPANEVGEVFIGDDQFLYVETYMTELTHPSSVSYAKLRLADLSSMLFSEFHYPGVSEESSHSATPGAETLSVSSSVAVSKGYNRDLSETLSVADSLGRSIVFQRGLTESIAISDLLDLAKNVLNEVLTVSSSVALSGSYNRNISESLSVSATVIGHNPTPAQKTSENLQVQDFVGFSVQRVVKERRDDGVNKRALDTIFRRKNRKR